MPEETTPTIAELAAVKRATFEVHDFDEKTEILILRYSPWDLGTEGATKVFVAIDLSTVTPFCGRTALEAAVACAKRRFQL